MKKDSVQIAANVAKAGLIILWVVFMIALSSCSVNKTNNHYPKPKLSSQVSAQDSVPDYFYINNQIVMIERQR
jgi:hypothetical protein